MTSAGTSGGIEAKYTYFYFTGDNFAEWKFQTKVVAKKMKALTILEGTEVRPALGFKDFDDRNEALYYHIFNTLKQAQQQFLRNVPIGDGAAAYKALLDIFEPHTRAAVKQQLKALMSLKQRGKDMAVFVADIIETTGKLNAALAETKLDLMDILKILVLLDGLDAEHALLREQLLLDDNITFTAASAACIKKAEIAGYARDEDTSASAKAAVQVQGAYCPHCFKEKGKKLPHTVDKCFSLHPELKAQFQKQRNNNKSNGKHQRHQKGGGGNNQNKGKGGAAAAKQVPSSDSSTAWSAKALSAASSSVRYQDPQEDQEYKTFELDSCAYPHFVTNSAGLSDIDHSKKLSVASCGPATYKTEGVGILGKHLPIGPMSVHVAPQFRSNLASVALLCDTGREIHFSKDGVKIVNPDTQQVEYNGDRVGNTYQLRIRLTGSSSHASQAVAQPQEVTVTKASQLKRYDTPTLIRLWHCRFPHPSACRLYEAVHGVHITGTGIPTDTPLKVYEDAIAGCKSCALGKARLPPHHGKAVPDHKSTQAPLEKIHYDIKTINKRSWGNNFYAGIVVDDYTREKFCLPMTRKSDTSAKLTGFNKEVVRPRQCDTKAIHLDRGGEQRGAEFKDYLSNCRIKPEYTSPGDSAANGVAERAIEVVEGGANTMRVHGNLPTTAWAELYGSTCFLESYLPTSANPGKKSPYEMRHNKSKDVSFLRTIGTECVVYTMPKDRRAQEDRGLRGKLVGYSTTSRCYRVKIDGSTTIRESAHVTFFEKVPQQGEPLVTEGDDGAEELEAGELSMSSSSSSPTPIAYTDPDSMQEMTDSTPQSSQESSSQSSTDHIYVPDDLVDFIDPDLVAEGEIVATPHTTMRLPDAQPQPSQQQRSKGHQQQQQPASQPPRRGRSGGSDSLQKLQS